MSRFHERLFSFLLSPHFLFNLSMYTFSFFCPLLSIDHSLRVLLETSNLWSLIWRQPTALWCKETFRRSVWSTPSWDALGSPSPIPGPFEFSVVPALCGFMCTWFMCLCAGSRASVHFHTHKCSQLMLGTGCRVLDLAMCLGGHPQLAPPPGRHVFWPFWTEETIHFPPPPPHWDSWSINCAKRSWHSREIRVSWLPNLSSHQAQFQKWLQLVSSMFPYTTNREDKSIEEVGVRKWCPELWSW